MEASSATRRLLAGLMVRDWAWWRLPWLLRCYVGSVPLATLVLLGCVIPQTTWRASDLVTFLVLLGCGVISVVATPRIAYLQAGLVRDFLTVWVLPVAILLPPAYAMVTPAPLLILTQWRVHRGGGSPPGFTGAANGPALRGGYSPLHAIPASFAGPAIGTGA